VPCRACLLGERVLLKMVAGTVYINIILNAN
jgi:hypothetical protein